MSVTIESLDIQIKSSAGSAAKNINELANALSKLNANSQVTKVVNSLNKLNGALTSMKSQQAVMSHLSALSKSLAHLAAIPKLTGLQSAIRELNKLPAVMQNLDTAQISQFTAKMKLLATGLGPLATQIDKISKGFSKLPPQVSKTVTAVQRLDNANKAAAKSTKSHGEALNSQSFNLLATYEHLQNVLGIVHAIQDGFARLLNDAIQWDGIQFQFGRAFGEDADMVLEYAEKVSKTLKINQQQFMESSSLYGSLLKGFGVDQKQVTTMAVGLAELSYDIWAAYNNRYKTLEDASEAVRSAITGEIEPIRNAGIALTEASMQEYLDSIGMAHISLEKLTEAQKSEVRYAVMVNAAMNQGIIGTYAREMETAEGAVRTLTQQLKTLGQAIGSLFIPMLKVVIPWISAFVELITEGVIALGALFGIKFQEITWGDAKGMAQTAKGADATANALGDAAKSAKAMKDYTMGFDELNIIKPDSGNSDTGAGGAGAGGTGGSLGLDLDTLWDDAVFDSASKQVDEIKAKIKDFYDEWKLQIDVIGAALAAISIASLLTKLGEALKLGNLFLGTMKAIKSLAVGAIIITLQYSLASKFLESYIDGDGFKNYVAAMIVNALGTWLLYSKFGSTGLIIGLTVTAFVSLKALFEEGGINSTEGIVTALTGIAAGGVAIALSWKKVAGVITVVKAFFAALLGSKAAESALVFLGKVGLANFAAGVHNLGATLVSFVTKLPSLLFNALKAIPTLLVNLLRAIPVWGWVATAIAGMLTLAIVDHDFSDIGYKIGHALGSALKKVSEWVKEIREALMEGIVNAWGWVKDTFDIDNVFELIQLMFNPVTWLTKIVPKMLEIGKEVLPGLWEGIKSGWNNFWSNIAEFISGFIKGFKDGLGIASPSKKFSEIGGYVIDGLLQGFTSGWKAIEKWYKTSIAPKFTIAYWLNVYESLRSAAAAKLEETKATLVEKWAAIKNWYDENIAPKFTLRYWMNQFFNLDTAFTNTIKNAINAGIDLMNRFIDWVNSKLSFSWDGLSIAGKEIYPGGSVQLFTITHIPRFEQGGVLEDGLFTMNRGEIAGKFSNGTSVVANNQMIVDGIAAGVYQAVVRAMNDANGSQGQSINVYLDGKQIYASVRKRESERGRQLIGNQLGYVY